MKEIVFVLVVLLSSFNCFAQEMETSDIFSSDKYQKLKDYYIVSLDNGKTQELNTLKKEIISKIGMDNISKLKDFHNIEEWLNNNWKSTHFASLEESKSYFAHFNSLSDELKKMFEKMTPLFSELREEVGYDALIKKLSEDYLASLSN